MFVQFGLVFYRLDEVVEQQREDFLQAKPLSRMRGMSHAELIGSEL